MKNYNWATLGCGVIANELAAALKSRGQKLYSVANRTHEKAVAFAEKYGIEKVYNDIDELFKDENVDIIYISTPHNTHIKYLRKALAAGKHVLCEKSITLNSDELDEAISLAEKNHVVLAEAMTIFHMPIYKALLEKVNSGDLGELRLIQMNFGSYKEYNMNNRFFNRNLAGGAMLDIGVYALSFVRMFMSSCPNDVLSQVKYAETGVDEQASILLKIKRRKWQLSFFHFTQNSQSVAQSRLTRVMLKSLNIPEAWRQRLHTRLTAIVKQSRQVRQRTLCFMRLKIWKRR